MEMRVHTIVKSQVIYVVATRIVFSIVTTSNVFLVIPYANTAS